MATLELCAWHGVAMLCVAATVPINFWMMMTIGGLRKKHGIEYPQMTSEKHPDFTCAQRAHQNTLELLPFYLATLFGASLRHPLLASVSGLLFLVGRVKYASGYYTGDPEKRVPGAIMSFAAIGLLTLLSVSSAAAPLQWW